MLFVFDLDGVIYRELTLIKGAVETTKYLQEKGHTVTYATNNAMLSRAQYLRKLRGMGLDCKIDEIMCVSRAASVYMEEHGPKRKTIFVVGEKGLKKDLSGPKTKILGVGSEKEKADYVIVGLDRKFNFRKLFKAQQYFFNGAKLVATNKDATYPAANNRIFPGCGSIVAAIEAACGAEAYVIGKPRAFMLDILFKTTGYAPSETVVVGDRPETDILFGKNAKTKTVLVLTGITKKKDVRGLRGRLKPDIVLNSVADLRKIY
jgi:phosphoglycolate/pyridoxal phosphate phosphatase family enzyme